jgi:hypothetical protein
VAKDTQISQYEERRLLTISLACSVQEQVAADQLLHPRHDMPARIQLADAYQSLRVRVQGEMACTQDISNQDARREDKGLGCSSLNATAV